MCVSRHAGTSIAAILAVHMFLLSVVPAAAASLLPMEHSFDGVTFSPAGKIQLAAAVRGSGAHPRLA